MIIGSISAFSDAARSAATCEFCTFLGNDIALPGSRMTAPACGLGSCGVEIRLRPDNAERAPVAVAVRDRLSGEISASADHASCKDSREGCNHQLTILHREWGNGYECCCYNNIFFNTCKYLSNHSKSTNATNIRNARRSISFVIVAFLALLAILLFGEFSRVIS